MESHKQLNKAPASLFICIISFLLAAHTLIYSQNQVIVAKEHNIILTNKNYQEESTISSKLEITYVDSPKLLRDPRAIKLERYLHSRNSPLTSYADLIISLSDNYDVDYRLIIAIAGIESSLCLYNFRPNNCWGYGDYAWPNLETALREYYRLMNIYYFSKGRKTLYTIAQIYNPEPAAYIQKVEKFLREVP